MCVHHLHKLVVELLKCRITVFLMHFFYTVCHVFVNDFRMFSRKVVCLHHHHVCMCVCLLSQCVIKLSLLEAIQPVGPCGGGHAAVWVQQDSEAAHNQHAEEDEEEDDEGECGLLLQGHAGHRTRCLQGGGERLGLHQPGDLQRLVPQQTLTHPHAPHILHTDLIFVSQ